jgi:hypothetical protein
LRLSLGGVTALLKKSGARGIDFRRLSLQSGEMEPFNLPLSAIKGASLRETLTWRPGGTPADLTGCTASLEVRFSGRDTANLIHLTSSSGITLGGALGTIELEFTPAHTNVSWTSARYRLMITHPNGDVTPLAVGDFTIRTGFE